MSKSIKELSWKGFKLIYFLICIANIKSIFATQP